MIYVRPVQCVAHGHLMTTTVLVHIQSIDCQWTWSMSPHGQWARSSQICNQDWGRWAGICCWAHLCTCHLLITYLYSYSIPTNLQSAINQQLPQLDPLQLIPFTAHLTYILFILYSIYANQSLYLDNIHMQMHSV